MTQRPHKPYYPRYRFKSDEEWEMANGMDEASTIPYWHSSLIEESGDVFTPSAEPKDPNQ